MSSNFSYSSVPFLGNEGQTAHLWRFHFGRFFLKDTHGSLFIGSEEAYNLGETYFAERFACESIFTDDKLIKRHGEDHIPSRAKLLHTVVNALSNTFTSRPVLLSCKDGCGVSAAFSIAYTLYTNITEFVKGNKNVDVLTLKSAIAKIRSICADLYSAVPLVDLSNGKPASTPHYISHRQILDPTIPDHQLWISALDLWATTLLSSLPRQHQLRIVGHLRNHIGLHTSHSYTDIPTRLSAPVVAGGVDDEEEDVFVEEFDEESDAEEGSDTAFDLSVLNHAHDDLVQLGGDDVAGLNALPVAPTPALAPPVNDDDDFFDDFDEQGWQNDDETEEFGFDSLLPQDDDSMQAQDDDGSIMDLQGHMDGDLEISELDQPSLSTHFHTNFEFGDDIDDAGLLPASDDEDVF